MTGGRSRGYVDLFWPMAVVIRKLLVGPSAATEPFRMHVSAPHFLSKNREMGWSSASAPAAPHIALALGISIPARAAEGYSSSNSMTCEYEGPRRGVPAMASTMPARTVNRQPPTIRRWPKVCDAPPPKRSASPAPSKAPAKAPAGPKPKNPLMLELPSRSPKTAESTAADPKPAAAKPIIVPKRAAHVTVSIFISASPHS